MCSTEQAIREVSNAWGIDDKSRMMAIRAILNGADITPILDVITEIRNGQASLLSVTKNYIHYY